MTLSKTEVEYIATSSCCAQIVWMKQMLCDYGINQGVMTIHCENISVINISNNLVQHSCTKHIDIKYHFIRELVEKQSIILYYIPTVKQLGDIMTKPLGEHRYERLFMSIGLLCSN